MVGVPILGATTCDDKSMILTLEAENKRLREALVLALPLVEAWDYTNSTRDWCEKSKRRGLIIRAALEVKP